MEPLERMAGDCEQEQTKWITTVIMSTALQVGYCLSRSASDSLGKAERRISHILYMEIFYSVSIISFFWMKQILV